MSRARDRPPARTQSRPGDRRDLGRWKRRDDAAHEATEATMPKLTDTQLVILSAAAARDGGAVLPLPDTMKLKGGATTSVLKGLLKKGLVAEQPAALGAEAWRETKDSVRVMLVITSAGLQAIGVTPDDKAGNRTPAAEPAPKKKARRRTARSKAAPKPVTGSPPLARAGTKQALLIDLLRAEGGATIDEFVAATGWQAHSVRGAISGALKKKLGLAVTSEPVEGRGRVYRIVEQQGAA